MLKAFIFDVYDTLLIRRKKDTQDPDPESLDIIKMCLMNTFRLDSSAWIDQFPSLIDNLVKKAHVTQVQKDGLPKKPEVVIEKIWQTVLFSLTGKKFPLKPIKACIFRYEQKINRVEIEEEAADILFFLKDKGFTLGLCSNAQFYTPLILREKLRIPTLYSVFNKQITLFSFKLGFAKPDQRVYKLLLKHLSKIKVQPAETLFVGNSPEEDIMQPRKFGFLTCYKGASVYPGADYAVESLGLLSNFVKPG